MRGSRVRYALGAAALLGAVLAPDLSQLIGIQTHGVQRLLVLLAQCLSSCSSTWTRARFAGRAETFEPPYP